MKRTKIRKNLKSFFRPVSIVIVPHNSFSSMRFKFSVFTFLAIVLLWTGFTLWSGYVAGRFFDYYITKADNAYLKTRVRYMSLKVEEGLNYLALARKTDRQLRKMLGMSVKEDYRNAIGGADLLQIKTFKKALMEKARRENFSKVDQSIYKMLNESNKRISSFSEISWYITSKYHFSRAIPLSWPAKGRITSSFGYRLSPITFQREFHSGVDIASAPGTPIYATADGVVRHAGWVSGYGLMVLVDHGFGYSTLYAHNSENLVKEKDRVKRGQVIAKIGSTGTSTGPHIHYEVWQNGMPKNPVAYIRMNNKVCESISIFESIFSHKI